MAASRSSVSRRNTIHDESLLPTALHSRKVDAIFKIEQLFMFTKLIESLIHYTKIHPRQKYFLQADQNPGIGHVSMDLLIFQNALSKWA